jgi:hypothetical protein
MESIAHLLSPIYIGEVLTTKRKNAKTQKRKNAKTQKRKLYLSRLLGHRSYKQDCFCLFNCHLKSQGECGRGRGRVRFCRRNVGRVNAPLEAVSFKESL